MPDRILVINPNSTEAVTRAMDDGWRGCASPGGPAIGCKTLREGPPGIESQTDADSRDRPAVPDHPRNGTDASAFVIACFSDPGLFSAREATRGRCSASPNAGS